MALNDTTDALGGTGSIAADLRQIAVGGLSKALDGYLSKKYALTSFNEGLTVDAYGNPLPKGAPQTQVNASQTLGDILRQPVVIAVGVAVAISLALVLVIGRR